MAFGCGGLLSLGGGGGGAGGSGDAWSDPVDSNIVPDGAGTRGIGSSSLQMGTIWATSLIAKQGALTIRNASTNILQSAASGDLGTLPSTESYSVGTVVPDAATDGFAMFSANNASVNTLPTKSMRWETGNKTAGTGDSGSFTFKPGTSSGGQPGMFYVNGGMRSTTTTVSSTSTIDHSANNVLASGNITLTLPTAVGIAGKLITFQKGDSSLSNAVTIDGDGTETINGSTTTTLNTQYETIEIMSNGVNWSIMRRSIPSEWDEYTPTFTGFGTAADVTFHWRRDGDSAEIRGIFTGGTPTAVEARISLPSGLTSADSSKLDTISLTGVGFYNVVGAFQAAPLIEQSVTYMTCGIQSASTAGIAKALGTQLLGVGSGMSIVATIPITGWKG